MVVAQPQQLAFDIPAGPLDKALLAFADQSKLQVLYDDATVQGRRAVRLQGRFTAQDGLRRLLSKSDIAAEQIRPGVYVLKRIGQLAANPPLSAVEPERLVAEPTTELAELIVTGSFIRGASPSSPIVTVSRDDIDRSGRASVADVLAALPQNYGNAASPTALLGLADTSGSNGSLARGVNLRGLGANATLVLVNGRRMAGSGSRGDIADISAIPTAAVQRVEVLLDGASALYGSDAVAGVVNLIPRRDWNGGELRLRLGATRGGAEQVQVSQAAGHTWDHGHLLLALEYQRDNELSSAKRPYTATSDLRAFGGADYRTIYSFPANIVAYSASVGAYVPTYAVPATGAKGVSDLIAGGRNLQNQRQGYSALPRQTRYSGFLDFRQELSDRLTLAGDLRFTRRDFAYSGQGAPSIFQITAANPYFLSPNGATSQLVAYNFYNELGASHSSGRSKSFGVSQALESRLWSDWRGEAYLAYAQQQSYLALPRQLSSTFLNEALGNSPDNPATAFSTAKDGFFNPFGGGRANNAAILDFIGSGWQTIDTISRVGTANIKLDGSLVDLPGGALKLAVGAQFRQEQFKNAVRISSSANAPATYGGRTFMRNISAAFVELRAPLVSDSNARPGIQRLELSLAGRVEHYEDAGSSATPKIGLLWSPVHDLSIRGTYGQSYRAPSLTEVNEEGSISSSTLTAPNGQLLAVVRYGGNKDLKPETARSWTFGFDWTPAFAKGVTINATAFDTRFKNRIGRPVLENFQKVLTDPAFTPFVRRVVPASNTGDLADVQALVAASTNTSIKLYPLTSFGAIIDARIVNAAELNVRGVDVSAAYSFIYEANRFSLGGSATYLLDFKRRLTPTAPITELVDTAGNPVDLRLRGSASWARGPLSANLTINYVDDYAATASKRVDSWTTIDLQLTWTAPDQTGSLKGLGLAISAQNLFDTDPPFYGSALGVGYDAANADPLGRFVSVQLSKRW
ncbi:TonB-dependent receptor [Caulobacter sp. RHG1]|uniref:TonB-dependent receptor n=1 Tax=Caulobacter sp. (strain RHG1) TaxID=2545762 RepID=UPI0015574C8D